MRNDEESLRSLAMSTAEETVAVGLTLVAANPSCEVQSPAMSLRMKRVVDIVGAIVGVFVCVVPAVLIALVVKVTSRGPVFFRQTRVGLGGVDFEMIKFRTMRQGTHQEVLADRAAHETYVENDFKLPPDDPRITSVGRVLRKLSIDEIPQFINVLRGDMSLVGIRPVERAQLELRTETDQTIYKSMPPGLTGSWQIDGRSSIVPHERLELDRDYVANWSLTGDIKILLRTPFAVMHISRTH